MYSYVHLIHDNIKCIYIVHTKYYYHIAGEKYIHTEYIPLYELCFKLNISDTLCL